MVVSLALPVVAWAMVPVGGVVPADAYSALVEAAEEHNLRIVGAEPAEVVPLPFWVAWHPVRTMERLQSTDAPTLLSAEDKATRYQLSGADELSFTCELQQRDGQVVWIRLDGVPETARAVKSLRSDLRMAMPWLPVSSPWQ